MRRNSSRFAAVVVAWAVTVSSLCTVGAQETSVCFSPGGNCAQRVVDAIDAARSAVQMEAYAFTNVPIVTALGRAAQRGVLVTLIVDGRYKSSQSPAQRAKEAGVSVFLDRAHAIAHNKVLIIDGFTVLTGSFNYTASANSRNSENLVTIHDKAIAARFTNDFGVHLHHSTAL